MSKEYLKYEVEDWIIDDDFIRYVNGQYPGLESTIAILTQDEKVAGVIEKAKKSILQLEESQIAVDESKLDDLFHKITHTIDNKQQPPKKSSKSSIVRTLWTLGIAASVALIIFFNLFSNKEDLYFTEIGEQQQLSLPDRSEVELNTHSQISFNKEKWEKERNVILEGEAFFRVEKGSKFTVQSEQGKVSVLGTQFNVYDREHLYQVECIEGKVKVELKEGGSYELLAGDMITIKDDQEPVVDRKVVEKIDWLNNYVDMRDVKLSYVLNEVEHYYQIHFEKSPDLDTLSYNGFFNTKSLDSALLQILWPLDIDYKIEGNIVRLHKR